MSKPRIRTHPGEVLLEEFMKPLGLSANALARDLHVPPNRIASIVATTAPRGITPDTALRLARYFGTTPQFWINLQSAHDLSLAECEIGDRVAEEVRPRAA
jgi:addiction module HigA family antidote